MSKVGQRRLFAREAQCAQCPRLPPCSLTFPLLVALHIDVEDGVGSTGLNITEGSQYRADADHSDAADRDHDLDAGKEPNRRGTETESDQAGKGLRAQSVVFAPHREKRIDGSDAVFPNEPIWEYGQHSKKDNMGSSRTKVSRFSRTKPFVKIGGEEHQKGGQETRPNGGHLSHTP
jgi:hypothetical protein